MNVFYDPTDIFAVIFTLLFPLSASCQTGSQTSFEKAIVASARSQIGTTVHYDPAYIGLSFPNGDFDRTRGVCTDVVIRALRDAHQIDLQSLVNADMKTGDNNTPRLYGIVKNASQ